MTGCRRTRPMQSTLFSSSEASDVYKRQVLHTFRLLVMNPTVGPHDVEAVLDHIARYSAEDWAQSA